MPVVVHVKVCDYPVMAQRLFPLVQCSRPLRFRSCSTLIRCSMSLLRSSSRFVQSRGRWSRSHSCSSISPGQVVARPLCATTSAHGRWSSQLSTVVNVPVIMRDSGDAPDSGHREFSVDISPQRQVLDFTVAAMMGLFDAFCVIFRAPPVVPELSASFSSFRALTTVSARGLHRVCQFDYGDVDIHTLITSGAVATVTPVPLLNALRTSPLSCFQGCVPRAHRQPCYSPRSERTRVFINGYRVCLPQTHQFNRVGTKDLLITALARRS